MIGWLRNAAVIGLMAYHSPVHGDRAGTASAALRTSSGEAVHHATAVAPKLAAQAYAALDEDSRNKLSKMAADSALRYVAGHITQALR